MKISFLFYLATLGFTAPPLFCGEVAESPYCAEIKDWAPWAGIELEVVDIGRVNQIDPISTTVVEPRVSSKGKDQGYYLSSVFSGSACTRRAFDSLPFYSGISCLSAHGERASSAIDSDPNIYEPDTEVIVYVSPHSDPIKQDRVPGAPLLAMDDILNWISSGVLNEGLKPTGLICIDSVTRKHVIRRMVVARKKWFKLHWKGIHNTQRTLMIAHVCGSKPILDSLGGRVGFGFEERTLVSVAQLSFSAILDSMNGTGAELSGDIPGTKRMAGNAITSGFSAIMVGNPLTTLCPSVVHPAVIDQSSDPNVADPVFPLGKNAPLGGSAEVTGHVTFDTIMNRSVPADTILTYNIESGNVEIIRGSIQWVSNHKIQFKYKSSNYSCPIGTVSFQVEMRVNARLARAANSNYPLGTGNKYLDGGDVGENRAGLHGIANNGDDFVWKFSRQ